MDVLQDTQGEREVVVVREVELLMALNEVDMARIDVRREEATAFVAATTTEEERGETTRREVVMAMALVALLVEGVNSVLHRLVGCASKGLNYVAGQLLSFDHVLHLSKGLSNAYSFSASV